MDDKSQIGHLPEAIGAASAAVGAWFAARGARLRALARRVTRLEKERVTRDDFDELRSSLTASISHNQQRTEERLDRIWEHLAGGR